MGLTKEVADDRKSKVNDKKEDDHEKRDKDHSGNSRRFFLPTHSGSDSPVVVTADFASHKICKAALGHLLDLTKEAT